jgi:hypothetical protein
LNSTNTEKKISFASVMLHDKKKATTFNII